jgi:tetratricopeptide (TPR) repeat protein
MNLKFLAMNFDFKKDLASQGRFLFRRRNYLKAILYVLLWLMLSCGDFLFGQTLYAANSLVQPLNDTGGSARALAMGSAFVGVADDSSALLWNPAGLGVMKEGQLALHTDSWLVGTFQESLVVGMPAGNMGGFGVMASYLDYGTFQGRDASGNITSNYTANKAGFSLGWGKLLAPGFSMGLALNGTQQAVLGNSYLLAAGSLGLLFDIDPHLRFGTALIDFGGNQAQGWVTSAIRAGFSYKTSFSSSHSFLLSLGGTLEPQGVDRLEVGAEYAFRSQYFLRVGYDYYFQDNLIEGIQGFTAGAGIRLGDLQLDYAYLPYGDLGTSNQISLSYLFPQAKPQPAAVSNPGAPPALFKPEAGTDAPKNVLTMQFDVPPDPLAQAQTLDGQGRTVEAMRIYEYYLKQNGQDANAWYYLGADYYKLDQKSYAVMCFEKVLKLKPDFQGLADWLQKYKASSP